MTASDIQFTELEEIVGDIEIPCDYDRIFRCGPAAAGWEMRAVCGCGNKAVRLACESCKDAILQTEDGMSCSVCDAVTIPARHLFWHIERIF